MNHNKSLIEKGEAMTDNELNENEDMIERIDQMKQTIKTLKNSTI